MVIGIGIGISYGQRRRGDTLASVIAALFAAGEKGAFFDLAPEYLFQDDAGTTPVAEPGQPVGFVTDRSGNDSHATQVTVEARPEYLAGPDRMKLDTVDDNMSVDFGAPFSGTVFQGTPNGVIHYDVSVPSGNWNLTNHPAYVPDNGEITGLIAREGSLTIGEADAVKKYLRKNGAGDNFAGVTSMDSWFRGRSEITALYVEDWDTSSVGLLRDFVRDTGITTLDISNWDTSSLVNFASFARNSSLTTVIVNGGTGNPFADSACTNYTNAFLGTNLTQQSIDDILVAIEQAGTSNGDFRQSGGSAPSATGEAAIDALRGRGWSISVTGGY